MQPPPGEPPPLANPPDYGEQAKGGSVPNDSMAIWALVLGIIGVVPCCSFAGPIAFFLGQSSRNRIRVSGGTLGGERMATAGWIMGIAGSVVFALVIFWFIWATVIQISNPAVR